MTTSLPSSKFFLLIVGGLLLGGCSGALVQNAPVSETPSAFPNHSVERIVFEMASRDSLIQTFRSDGRIHFQTPEISQGVGTSIRASLVDSVYARLRGPLALDIGRALITRDSIFAHDKLNESFYYGHLSVANNYVPGAGVPGLLGKTLIGAIYPTLVADAEIAVESDSASYIISIRGAENQRWVIDPSFWRVVLMEELNADGSVLTRREFSEFDTVDGMILPRHIVLSSLQDGLVVTIEHQNLSINPENISYPFSRPSHVEEIRLE